MKSRFLFFGLLFALTLAFDVSFGQAPSVTITNKKDACRDLLDAGGLPGTDGTLDNGSITITVTSGIPAITLFILGPVNYINIPVNLGVPYEALNLKPGVYNVIVQDGNPSDFVGNFIISGTTDITASITPGFPINSTSCGTPNGQISIDVSGGTGSYAYSWTATNGFTSSTEDISGLLAGDYTVVITDNGTNCSQTIGPISVTQPPAPSNAVLSLTGASPICNGESSSIRVDVTDGTGPFNLTITNLGVITNYTSGTDIPVSPTASTTYTLTAVTDVNGCASVAVSGAVNITVNPTPVAPAITFTPNTYCVGDAIIAPTVTTPVGTSTYTWYSDAALTTLLTSGTTPSNAALGFSSATANVTSVFVTETNSFNCTGPATTITLTVNANPVAPVVTFTPSTYCVGEVITPPVISTPVGTSTYTWYSDISLSTILTTGTAPTNAQLGFSSATANTKTVFVTETNASNCEGPATTITLTVGAQPLAPGVTFMPSTYCVGDPITPPVITTPVGTSTYNWYGDAGLTTLLTTGSNPANGALGFSSATANATTVFVTETSAGNCTGPATPVTLTVNPIPAAPAVTFTPNSYCVGNPITAPTITTPVGGSTYRWYSDASLSTFLVASTAPTNAQLGFSSATANTTTVFVTETNSSSCEGPATAVTLTVNAVPVAPAITFSPSAYCVGNTITPPAVTTPVGSSTYNWYSDAGLTTLLATGSNPTAAVLGFSTATPNTTSVFVTETSGSNCTGPATTVTLTVNAVPVAPAVTFTPNTVCVGAVITPPTVTTPIGGSIYTWYSDAALTSVLTTGANPTNVLLGFSSATPNSTTVFVTETSITLCEGPATAITLTVNAVPTAPAITFTPSTYCVGQAIIPPVVTTPVGTSTYTWYDDAGLTIVLATGTNPTNVQLGFSSAAVISKTVFVAETNVTNCQGPATAITLTVNATPAAPIVTFTPNTFCEGDAITPPVITTPVVGSVYSWYSDAGLTTLLVTGDAPSNASLGFSSTTANSTTVYVTETNNSCTGPATAITLTVNALPTASLTGGVSICIGQSTDITFSFTGTGPWTFQYSDGSTTFPGNSASSSAIVSVSPTVNTTYTLLSVSDANCVGTVTGTPVTVTVDTPPVVGLAVTAVNSPVCSGGSTNIEIAASEVGVTYQLRNNADNSLIGAALTGTGAILSLPTGSLTATTTFNILATSGACASVQLTTTATVNVLPAIDISLGVAAQNAAVCSGSATNIQVSNSQSGVTYQLRNDADDSAIGAPVAGTGATIDLPTGNLISATIFNVFADNGTCSIELTATASVSVDVNPNPALVVTGPTASLCSGGSATITIANAENGVSYQLRNDADDSPVGVASIGAGTDLLINTGVLSATTTFNILASSGVCTPVELAGLVTVTVSGTIDLTLGVSAQIATLCAGSGTNIRVTNSENGVSYQLRDDADNSAIGTPVAGTGATIDLPTGLLTATTTFNVFATSATCSAALTAEVTVTVEPTPDASLNAGALSSTICFGTTTSIGISNSEIGVSYQLRDDATDTPIGSAVVGTGSVITLSTGALTANTSFNVLATLGTCAVQLADIVSVNVLPSGDPLCAPVNNCATVSIGVTTTLATCGAATPDGTVTFDINPPTPTINLIGVKIDIDGPVQVTQFNDFLFEGLPVGLYNYTIIYGDDTNPVCTKVGNFTIDPTGVPDVVDFNILTSEYVCVQNAGTVDLVDFFGAANTDYTLEIYQDGTIVNTVLITKDEAASGSVRITGLALGEYQLQLFQDQSAVNGCVGVERSQFKQLIMEEPQFGCEMFIPNIFTPNGDGSNDLLVIRNKPAGVQLMITNRWGKEVYSSSDYQNDWTGDDVIDGVYYYKIIVADQKYTGWIEIMRGK